MTESTTAPRNLDARSNAEIKARWKIDASTQPEDRPLAELDPGNGDGLNRTKSYACLNVYGSNRRCI